MHAAQWVLLPTVKFVNFYLIQKGKIMKGKIIHFDSATKTGFINSANDQRYSFTADEWKSDTPPKNGVEVDFVAADNVATQIFSLQKNIVPDEISSAATAVFSAANTITGEVSQSLSKFKDGIQKENLLLNFKSKMQNKAAFSGVGFFAISLFFSVMVNKDRISKSLFNGEATSDISFFDFSFSNMVFVVILALLALVYLGKSATYIRLLCTFIIFAVAFVFFNGMVNGPANHTGRFGSYVPGLGIFFILASLLVMIYTVFFRKLNVRTIPSNDKS